MLYWLSAFSDTIGPLNVLRYITFRTGGAMFTALVFVFLFGHSIIDLLRLKQGKGQPIRSDGPQSHLVTKKGTPTMGGLMMLFSLMVSTVLWANLANRYVWIVLGVALGFGLIGLCDDYLEAASQSGLSDKVRIAVAAGIASLACLALMHLGAQQRGASLDVPFIGALDVGWLYIPIGALIIVAAGQVVNLADRLHARVIGPLLLVALSFGFMLFFAGNPVLANHFNLRYVPGIGELTVLCGAVTGTALGFLWFGAPPASMFVGATGSLALGGMFGAMAVAAKHEVVLAAYGLFVTAQG